MQSYLIKTLFAIAGLADSLTLGTAPIWKLVTGKQRSKISNAKRRRTSSSTCANDITSHHGAASRSIFDNSSSSTLLSTDGTWTGTTPRRSIRCVGACPFGRILALITSWLLDPTHLFVMLIHSQYYRRVCIPRFGHRPPNIDGKPVLNVDNLRVILTFNIAFDTSIFPGERHRISLAGCYQLLCYTGARPAELVDGERKKPKDNSLDELFGHKTSLSSSMENGTDPELSSNEKANLVEGLLTQETMGRGRPKALCYEDILMMIVRHPVTGRCIPAMAIKFIHHKGADNKPRP